MISVDAMKDELEKISTGHAAFRSGRKPLGMDTMVDHLGPSLAKISGALGLAALIGGSAIGGHLTAEKAKQIRGDYQLGKQIRRQQEG